MTKKKGPRVNLAVENYSKLNEMFYKNYNGNHFDVKSFDLLAILSNTDNCITQNDGLEIKFGKITFRNTATVKEDKDNFINYAKTELVSTYYHCLETFIRLFIAHSKLDCCPWLDIVSLSIPKYRNCLDDIINDKYSFIKNGETIDDVIKYILTGIPREEDTKYIDNIKTWITYAAHELKDIKSYNSLKHGLVNFNSHGKIKIKPDNSDSDKYFEKSGDTLQILKVVEKKDRFVYTMDTEFVDYDILFLKIHIYSEMINNIITIGKAYYTEEKVEMVKGLSAGMYSYHDVMQFVSKGDENNLGRFLSNYSMELLYYKDVEIKK